MINFFRSKKIKSPPPIIELGKASFTLTDLHCGLGCFGGIGNGATTAFALPVLQQLLQNLNDPDETSPYARCGGILLNRAGDLYTPFLEEFVKSGRNSSDLIVLDPSLDLFRYNPISPNSTPEGNAYKLGLSSPEYAMSEKNLLIRDALHLLEVGKEHLSIKSLWKLFYNKEYLQKVEEEVEKVPEYKGILREFKGIWKTCQGSTLDDTKKGITELFESLATNASLQEIFCTDTNFDIKDLINKGKWIYFKQGDLPEKTYSLLAHCLKYELQRITGHRSNPDLELNQERSVVFFCDEYPALATNKEDSNCFFTSRVTNVIPILGCETYSQIESRLGFHNTITLCYNISNWIFLRSSEEKTLEFASKLCELPTSNFIKLEIRTPEEFEREPWHSEALVYKYKEKPQKTKIPFLFYTCEDKELAHVTEHTLRIIHEDRSAQTRAYKLYQKDPEILDRLKNEKLLTACNKLRCRIIGEAEKYFPPYIHHAFQQQVQGIESYLKLSSPTKTLRELKDIKHIQTLASLDWLITSWIPNAKAIAPLEEIRQAIETRIDPCFDVADIILKTYLHTIHAVQESVA
jgi:hypothetical protein